MRDFLLVLVCRYTLRGESCLEGLFVRLFEFIGWMLGEWFAVLGGLFGLGVDVYGVLVSEYRFMGESGSVRLIWGLFGVCLTRIRILGGVCSVVRGFLFFSMPCIISVNPTK